MNYENLYSEIHAAARKRSYEVNGTNVMVFPCGFASVKFPVKVFGNKHPFILWLVEQKLVTYVGYERERYYSLWIGGEFNQSMSHKETYAEEFVRLLEENDIHGAKVWSRID